jgi:stage V sporulation protein B
MFIIFAHPVIGIVLSESFYPAASTLIVLTIYVYILSLTRPCYVLTSGINKPIIGAKIGAAMCLINIILNFLFIPKDGLLSLFGISGPLGAAIATATSGFIGFIWFKIVVKKIIPIKTAYGHIARHIFAGLIMALVLYLLSTYILTVRWYLLIVFALIGLALYLGILYVLKEFNKKDFDFFFNLIQPKEMMIYIKSELKDKK